MDELKQIQIMRNMYEKTLQYYKEIMKITEEIDDSQFDQLSRDYSHDINRYFAPSEVNYNIRNAMDRIYHLDNLERILQTKLITSRDIECEHTFVTDLIDIDPDKSKEIRYCSKCNHTIS